MDNFLSKQKLAALGVALLLPVSLLAWVAPSNDEIEEYDDIENCQQLHDDIRAKLDGRFRLTKSFSCADIENFEPIGDLEKPFTGTLDGNGHTIENLTINRPNDNYVGLFSFACNNANIRNINFKKANVTGNRAVGVLLGGAHSSNICAGPEKWFSISEATVTDSKVKAQWSMAGGLVGYVGQRIINPCTLELSELKNITINTVEVSAEQFAGGVVADIKQTNLDTVYINDSIITAEITAGGVAATAGINTIINKANVKDAVINIETWHAGGLVGEFTIDWYDRSKSSIKNSKATSTIKASSHANLWIGGLVGKLEHINIIKSSAKSTVIADSLQSHIYIGGLVGLMKSDRRASTKTQINESFSIVDFHLSGYGSDFFPITIGGLVAIVENGKIDNSYSRGKINTRLTLPEKTAVGGLIGAANITSEITNTYSVTALYSTPALRFMGGLVGAYLRNKSAKTDMGYWNRLDSRVMESPGGGTEATQEQMRTQAFYEENKWCFDLNGCGNSLPQVWQMGDGEYPYPILVNVPQ